MAATSYKALHSEVEEHTITKKGKEFLTKLDELLAQYDANIYAQGLGGAGVVMRITVDGKTVFDLAN